MAYRTIVIENDENFLEDILYVLHRSPDFEVSANYKSAQAALGQAVMFKPNFFLISVDNATMLNSVKNFVETFPGAFILGTMSSWNPVIAKQAMDNGITGCVLKPFTAKQLLDYIRLYSARGLHKPAELISFFSPKGRAGRTTLAAVLALLIAEKTGERVALIDADLQFGDLPMFFDVEPERTIVDATQDIRLLTPITLEPYFHKIKDGVFLLASPARPEYAELVTPESLVDVAMMSANIFRYVIMDLPSGFNPLSLNLCRISDLVYVTTMINSGFEVKHTKKTLEMFESQAGENSKIHAVFTRVNPFTEEQREKIAEQLDYPVDVMIPNEYQMISVANSGRLARGLPQDTLLMKTISNLADEIIESGK
ncbi:MAG: P-loop NTPase [Selenomonadaceae bacterium]|nr:P-loop NTPase [Selenomonadaceae bacterium]